MSQFLGALRPLALSFLSLSLLNLVGCHSKEAPNPQVEAESQPAAQSQPPTVTTPVLEGKDQAYEAVGVSSAPPAPQTSEVQYRVAPLAKPVAQYEQGERYQKREDNPVHLVAEMPVSTFSIDVDTGSYSNLRRMLNVGQLPPANAVRLEEMVNYFTYDYAKPKNAAQPFGITTELAPSPWNPQTRLLRIGIKADDQRFNQLPPANLVFLVDISGSMDTQQGLPLVKSTLKLLVDQLREQDRVSLVVYAGESRVVLEPTSGSEKAKIRNAIEELQAGGSTAGEAGIQLAYRMAQKGYLKDGINRILLATDGDFNVGISDFDSLKALAAEKRRSGVSLTTLGYGQGNYNEELMEQLADAGDGNYAYIDNLREARKVLVEQLSSTLAVVAKDVKIQVEFNPAQVSQYRLLGYENRTLSREDFSNDKVDAGEIGSGHTVTALYEIVPAGNKGWVEPLRYQANPKVQTKKGELAMLRVRYKSAQGGSSQLIEQPIEVAEQHASLDQASDDLRFAAAVAAFAQQLTGARYTGNFEISDTVRLAKSARGEDSFGLRGEFIQLAELAQSLQTPVPK